MHVIYKYYVFSNLSEHHNLKVRSKDSVDTNKQFSINCKYSYTGTLVFLLLDKSKEHNYRIEKPRALQQSCVYKGMWAV